MHFCRSYGGPNLKQRTGTCPFSIFFPSPKISESILHESFSVNKWFPLKAFTFFCLKCFEESKSKKLLQDNVPSALIYPCTSCSLWNFLARLSFSPASSSLEEYRVLEMILHSNLNLEVVERRLLLWEVWSCKNTGYQTRIEIEAANSSLAINAGKPILLDVASLLGLFLFMLSRWCWKDGDMCDSWNCVPTVPHHYLGVTTGGALSRPSHHHRLRHRFPLNRNYLHPRIALSSQTMAILY